MVRLYRDYDPLISARDKPILVTAFRGLSEMVPVRGGSGMVMEWFQPTGTLLCGGDSKVVRVWDANTEVSAAVSDCSGSASCSAMGSICTVLHILRSVASLFFHADAFCDLFYSLVVSAFSFLLL